MTNIRELPIKELREKLIRIANEVGLEYAQAIIQDYTRRDVLDRIDKIRKIV